MAIILVTGADGQLGNELRLVSKNYYGYDFVFTDKDNLDLTDPKKVRESIDTIKPGWIINCAAYTQVDRAENEYAPAMRINADSVRNITDAIKETATRLIHISTDYVYEGTACIPYNETSTPNPLSVYGRSKLEGEKNALLYPASLIIRTSWLYSSFGNNFLKTILKKGRDTENLNVVFDQTGSPTYAADLASAIMHIVSGVIRNQFAFKSGVYNYSDEGVCSWFDFAREIIKEAGYKCRISPILSKDFPQVAKRPSYAVMDKSKIKDDFKLEIPHWRDSLLRCMKLIEY
ncbi:MAG TPA: dTDP-4-dehydrorhamnose reductase [Bacteroidales bacterium]|nr:dTDP-4-dehydrorhamnose reductase [Bacteroidales bacterium]